MKEFSGRGRRPQIPAPLLMVAATLLFATMSMCVKIASEDYSVGEIVFYRGVDGSIHDDIARRGAWPDVTHQLAIYALLEKLHRREFARPVVLCHRKIAAFHRRDIELHVSHLDGCTPHWSLGIP